MPAHADSVIMISRGSDVTKLEKLMITITFLFNMKALVPFVCLLL